MEYNVDENGYYGTFGGAYIPEILYANVETLRNNYLNIISEEGFQKELDTLMRDYVGRPSPLYYARRLSEKYGAPVKPLDVLGMDLPQARGPEPYRRA